jgi:amidase
MGMSYLCHLPAHELVRLMSSGAVSCREVVRAHLERIEAINPALNALVEAADPEECLRLADLADERAAHGDPLGAAHGLPVVIKDVMKVAGLACSGGSSALRAVADVDATAVARLKAAGAIVLGLTNVPELGRGGETNNNLYGRTNNPYDRARTPGGSSGGSAALVAAGGAAFSVGTDEGGSIRQPCHNTGIAGLKPSHGRIPRTGNVFGDAPGIFGPFCNYGPLARSVPDLFLGLAIMSGPDLLDPYAVPATLGKPDEVDLRAARRHLPRRRHLAAHRRGRRCGHRRRRGDGGSGRRSAARDAGLPRSHHGAAVDIGLPRRRPWTGVRSRPASDGRHRFLRRTGRIPRPGKGSRILFN